MSARKIGFLILLLGFGAVIQTAWSVRERRHGEIDRRGEGRSRAGEVALELSGKGRVAPGLLVERVGARRGRERDRAHSPVSRDDDEITER